MQMADKLNSGAAFPSMALRLTSGGTLRLSEGLDARYKVILFYRGHW
jgi:peroxiredoxin